MENYAVHSKLYNQLQVFVCFSHKTNAMHLPHPKSDTNYEKLYK